MNAPGFHAGHDGVDGPLNPYGVTPPPPDKDDEIPGYVKRFGAYNTLSDGSLSEGVFLPAGTLLPRGCNFAMQATIDFGLHFPKGTKVPGGFLLPVSVVKKKKEEEVVVVQENPLCVIQ